MPYKTGKSKSLDDITLADVLAHPIWEWAYDEAGEGSQDETWQRPILDADNVTDEIDTPIITLKIKDTGYFASGEYDAQDKLIRAIAFWEDDEWKLPPDFSKQPFPLILVAVPKIAGVANIEFQYANPDEDEAYQIN